MSEQILSNTPVLHAPSDEIHFLDLLVILARHKFLVIGTAVLVTLAAVVASLVMTPMFSSTVKILPPQQQQSSGMAAVLGQLGGLAGAAGSLGGLKTPTDMYVGLLESRTVADNLIARFKLTERYGRKMEDTRHALASNTDVSAGKKDGMLSVTVIDRDPQFAADIANAYADELARMTQTMALTEASQRRLFFEKQLSDTKEQLATAEIAMRTTQEKTGLIQPDAQVQAIIGNAAQLKGTIAAKEVEINAMRTFATGNNPELMRAREELRGMQVQLAKLESVQPAGQGGFMVPTGKLPAVGVEYVRSLRNVKYYETIFELLAKQFELAKIDEAKQGAVIQVLDKAIPAESKFKPKRVLIVLVGALAGLVLGMLFAFLRHAYLTSLTYPESRARWDQLGKALRGSNKSRAA